MSPTAVANLTQKEAEAEAAVARQLFSDPANTFSYSRRTFLTGNLFEQPPPNNDWQLVVYKPPGKNPKVTKGIASLQNLAKRGAVVNCGLYQPPQLSVMTATKEDMDEDELFLVDGTSARREVMRLSPLCRELWGTFLENSTMGQMSNWSSFFGKGSSMTNPNSQLHANSELSKGPTDFVGVVRCAVNHKLSTTNEMGIPFSVQRDGTWHFAEGFWSGQLLRRGGAANRKTLMNLAVTIPPELLDPADLQNHSAGSALLRERDVAVQGGGDYMRLQLYGTYATAMASLLSMPIVFTAQKYGFHPVFFFKNFMAQTNNYCGGFDLRSIDQGAKSFFVLLGFTRQSPATGAKDWLSLVHSSGKYAQPHAFLN